MDPKALFESDTGFYFAVGAFTIVVFLVGLAVLALVRPGPVGTRELAGLVVGFFVYMLVFFVSVSIHRLEGGDGV